MKKKMRKFSDGGGIDSDVRSRAMKSVEGLEGIKGADIEDETGTSKGSIKRNEYGDLYDSEMKATSKSSAASAKSKPKADDSSEKDRMEKLTKKQALERVEPENYIPGPGLFRGLLKSAMRTGEKEGARTITTRAGKEVSVKQGKPDFSGSAKEGMGVKEVKNKSGKEIPVTRMKSGGTASSRADGCAIRGKTRA